MNIDLFYKGKHLISVERPDLSGKIHLVEQRERNLSFVYRLSLTLPEKLKGEYDFKTYQEALDILTVL